MIVTCVDIRVFSEPTLKPFLIFALHDPIAPRSIPEYPLLHPLGPVPRRHSDSDSPASNAAAGYCKTFQSTR